MQILKRTDKILVCLLSLSLLFCSCSTSVESIPPLPLHVLESDTNYDLLWENDIYWIDRDERTPKIIGVPGKIVIEGRNGEFHNLFIAAFESTTGNLIWYKPIWPAIESDMFAHNNRLYRGTNGASVAQAFDLNSGTLLWETKLPKAHSADGIYYEDNKLFVFTSDNMFFVLNETGEITNTSHKIFRTYFISAGIIYGEEFSYITATNQTSGDEIWRFDVGKEFRATPVFNNGMIFLRTRFIPNNIYSINQYTGALNWKKSHQGVVSNLYVTDKRVYFLSHNGDLVSLDRYSGEVISRDKFSPPFNLDKQNGGYFVSGDSTNNILVIAFGDNNQIIGLKIKNQ